MHEEPDRLTIEGIQAKFDGSPFISTLNLRAQALDYEAGALTVHMPLAASLERRAGSGQFHGGPIAALIDTVGDFAIGMLVGGGVPTMNLRIDYLKPAVGEGITAIAKVRRRGRMVTTVDIDVEDAKGALVAIGRGTFLSRRG